MTDEEHFAAIGRLYAQFEHESLQHRRTLEVLRQVKTGELDLERLEADGLKWRILPPANVVGIVDVADLKRAAAGAKEKDG